MHATCPMPPPIIILNLIILILDTMQVPPGSYYFLPVRSKYSPQHPVLKRPQSTFFPQHDIRKFHTQIKERQNYTSPIFIILLSIRLDVSERIKNVLRVEGRTLVNICTQRKLSQHFCGMDHYHVVCPQPPPKQVIHTVQSSASSFNLQYLPFLNVIQ
jgi:hypothetical protein